MEILTFIVKLHILQAVDKADAFGFWKQKIAAVSLRLQRGRKLEFPGVGGVEQALCFEAFKFYFYGAHMCQGTNLRVRQPGNGQCFVDRPVLLLIFFSPLLPGGFFRFPGGPVIGVIDGPCQIKRGFGHGSGDGNLWFI
ncbi:hypothetical protein LC724_28630 [Blautia sp. RD014234]|nr:hypothetical protein [Blautia parvula]